MPVKYIRPGNLITDRKTTKLVKQKKFISEEEYEMKMSVIRELLDELNLENFQIDENIKNDYENFSKIRDEVSDKIEDIINYIDELKNNEEYDIDHIKAIVKEKIEKEIYERYKIYHNTNREYIYKNLIIENMNKHISNIKYNKEKINNGNEKYKRINKFEKNLINDTIYKIKNIKDGDFIILYDENEYNIENINEFCIEDKYDKININNKNIEKYNFNGKLNEDYNIKISSIKYINENPGIKIVSIKKQCTKMSFYYKVKYNTYRNFIILYIDGIYKDKYNNTSWTQAIIDNLTDEEHEFTWVLYSSNAGYYSCVDTIAFNDIVETDSNKFSNTCENKIKYSYIYIEPEKDINFSNQQVKLNEEKYNEFVLSDRKNKIFKINPNNYSELESILQSPDIIDIIVSNENGDHVVLTTKAKQRIFTRDIDTNEPNMPFIIKSNPDAIGSLKVSNVKTEFNKSDLKVTNEIDIGELTNEIEDPVFEDIENGYCMKIEDVNE